MVVCMPWRLRCVCGASAGFCGVVLFGSAVLRWLVLLWRCCVVWVGMLWRVASVASLCGSVACFLYVLVSLYALAFALRLWGFCGLLLGVCVAVLLCMLWRVWLFGGLCLGAWL